MKKIKVLFVLHEINKGGATLSFVDFIESGKKYIDPYIVLPKEGNVSKFLHAKGFKTYIIPFVVDFLPQESIISLQEILFDNNRAAQKIAEVIEGEGIELIHSNTSVDNVGIIAACYANVPHIYHVRELVERQFDRKYCDEKFKKKVFECSNLVITISDAVKKNVEEKYGIDSTRIYDGIRKCSVDDLDCENRETNSFIFPGRITKNKGQWDAVRAVKELSDRNVNVKLYLVGSYNEKAFWVINKYIQNNGLENQVEILDFVDDLSLLRTKCRYSITGSEYEALGRVTIEAMLYKEFPIGVNAGGTSEIIADGCGVGLLYSFGDYKQLADKMEEAININKADLEEILDNNYKKAMDIFSPEKYVEEIYAIYKNVLENDTQKDFRIELKQYIEESLKDYDDKKENDIPIKQSVDYHEFIIRVEQYLRDYKYKKIAIYGMAKLGQDLYDYLEIKGFRISNVFDRAPDIIETTELGDPLELGTDAIVVTALREEQQVVQGLIDKYDIPIISRSTLGI